MRAATALILSSCLLGSALDARAGQADPCGPPWRLVFGGALDDRIEAVTQDHAGNVIAVGYSGGLLGIENFWPVGNSIGFVRKIDSNGVLLWERAFDTSGIDIVHAATVAPGGNIFVAGRTSGVFDGQSNGGQLDLFVAILSAQGDLVDLLESGDERPQHPVAVTALSDTAFAVAGYDDIWVWGAAVMDRQNEFVAEFHLDASGAIVEDASMRTDIVAPDMATGIAAAPDGSGDVFVSRYDGSDAQYGGGVFVDRLTAMGSIVWSTAISDFPFDSIAGVVVSRSNRVYTAGTTYAASTTGGESLGGADGFLVELDPATGVKKWARPLGSTESDWIASLSIDDESNFVIAGITQGVIAPGHVVVGDDPFALVVSPEGNAIGAWEGERDASSDPAYSVARACGDSLAFAGSLNGVVPSADLGRTDAELTRVDIVRFDTILRDGFERPN